jgi:hypothetical protein
VFAKWRTSTAGSVRKPGYDEWDSAIEPQDSYAQGTAAADEVVEAQRRRLWAKASRRRAKAHCGSEEAAVGGSQARLGA